MASVELARAGYRDRGRSLRADSRGLAVAFLAWLALAAGTLLIYSARKGLSPLETLRAIMTGAPTPAPTYVIEGADSLPKGVGSASKSGGGGRFVSAAGLTRPVSGAITSGFGMRNGRMHYGVDIPAPTGTPVYAALSGTVDRVAYDPTGAGAYVRVRHPNGWMTKYFHLSGFAVADGQDVTAGQTVGFVGSTGRSSGPHLHFELWIGGKAVDPQPYLDGQQGTVSV